MNSNPQTGVEKLITDYIQHKEMYLLYHKRKNDAEKEYNRLLVTFGGEVKNFSLDQAEKIYKTYQDMVVNEEASRMAEQRFIETERKMKELGQILFQATIHAEIPIPPVNGGNYSLKQVTVTYQNGEVLVY